MREKTNHFGMPHPTSPHPNPAFPFVVIAFPNNVMAFPINAMVPGLAAAPSHGQVPLEAKKLFWETSKKCYSGNCLAARALTNRRNCSSIKHQTSARLFVVAIHV